MSVKLLRIAVLAVVAVLIPVFAFGGSKVQVLTTKNLGVCAPPNFFRLYCRQYYRVPRPSRDGATRCEKWDYRCAPPTFK